MSKAPADFDKCEAISWKAQELGITSTLLLDGATNVEWDRLAELAGTDAPTDHERTYIIGQLREQLREQEEMTR